MNNEQPLSASVEFEVTKVTEADSSLAMVSVASEVPFTIVVNKKELATLLCTPSDLKELTYGFLFTSGIIQGPEDITEYTLDRSKWIGYVYLIQEPDFELLSKRIYTSGCGKGVMYSSYMELASRKPIDNKYKFDKAAISAGMHFLLQCSTLYKKTRSIHTVAISKQGELPYSAIDDIGRHNALDKIIGKALLEGLDFSQCILFGTGRISSEMLHKAKRAEIPVIVSRGAPTHQAILRARAMGITLAGSVRQSGFTLFSHPERIVGV